MNSRGPYRKYLQDAREEVPATTIQSRRRNEIQAELIFNNQEENNAVENIIGMHDEALQQFEEINEHSSIDENNSSDDEIYNNQVNNANDEENIFDGEHGEDGNNEEMRQPIYENCPLTQDESDLLIMSFIIRHGLTDLAFDDLLNLINCHLPITLNFSWHFLKKFSKTANMKTIFYCPECFVELNFEQMTHINCTSCNIWYMRIDLVRSGHYFVHLPLKDQLRNLLPGPLFYKLQRGCVEQSSILSDITSGESYRRLRRNGVIRDYDITLQWNADGVDTSKSSKVSMCPIQVAINELPYCLHKENILLSSIWCSAKKPVMDLFLKPFVDDLKDLHENGFHCLPPVLDAPVHVRVHTIVAPVDSVARCALQNVHQFNGKFGCSFCLCPGDRVKVGNGYARVYLEKGEARTKNQHLKDSQKAVRKEKVVRDVKGMSHLMFVPGFDIIQSFPPEYMHSILLGVVKSFIIVWFTNCHNPSYISTKKNIFDEKLTSIRPPSEITRTPRSINDIKVRKASELKKFPSLLFYAMFKKCTFKTLL